MASGGRRGGAGERVLEGRHVIGLFCLMLLFSGVFFTLGYVMGKNQIDGQVRTATNLRLPADAAVAARNESAAKRVGNPSSSSNATDPTARPYPEWEFYHAGESKKTDDHLKSAGPPRAPRTVSAATRTNAPPKAPPAAGKTSLNPPLIPGGALVLQVAAMRRESDALALAENLQKKKFPAYVTTPNGDKFYRVQVGPYADQKSADAARKGLETAGFKAIVKH